MIAHVAGLATLEYTLHTEAYHMHEGSGDLIPLMNELNPMEIDIDEGGTVFQGQSCEQGPQAHEA